ncbi:MAG: sigma-70 family RNA polymerase sigma factor [Syntrophus sp. (in: bacteria)]
MESGEIRFQQVYDEYQGKILRYLTRMVGENEAEDLTQEVFVKIGQALETFRGESSLSTWIYQIATNAALDKLRHPSNRHVGGKLLPVEAITETKEDENIWTGEVMASTEQRVIRQEMNGCIREIIQTLPETYRSVIVLSELEGLSDAEIADILGLTLQAAKIRLHRARARLRKELTTACIFYRDDRHEFACDRKTPHTD